MIVTVREAQDGWGTSYYELRFLDMMTPAWNPEEFDGKVREVLARTGHDPTVWLGWKEE